MKMIMTYFLKIQKQFGDASEATFARSAVWLIVLCERQRKLRISSFKVGLFSFAVLPMCQAQTQDLKNLVF